MAARVKVAVIGLGNMGRQHLELLGALPTAELVAVCDLDPAAIERGALAASVATFTDPLALIASGVADAVIIATPHFSHTPIGIAALRSGAHVLVEKPISVHKADCESLIEAWQGPPQVFAAMFNQRTDPRYVTLKGLIGAGELGRVTRFNWTITDWFRTQTYYDAGGWRATWRGEGGGVLTNQCPHQLDLVTWLFGSPASVYAQVGIGKYHHIEVEDEVTAILSYADGMTGVFVTTTGEAPGTNRLEIAGTRAKVVVEGLQLEITRNAVPADQFCAESKEGFATPARATERVVFEGEGPQHRGVLENFINAVLGREELIAPASEGIHSVELANAMMTSGFSGERVALPLCGQGYAERLARLQEGSSFVKNAVVSDQGNFEDSF